MNIIEYKATFIPNKKTNLLILIFLISGLIIRSFHFFYNRSLWLDEVYLSTSLIKFNYLKLATQPLYYQQKAPIGFLWAVRFFLNIFGYKEIYLRIVPLISGIISMFLFVPVSRYFLKEKAAILAIGVLCLSPALTYHSVEIKQYSTELFCTLLCFYLLIRFKDKVQIKTMFIWGFAGAIILWFSYSSIFILAGMAFALSMQYVIQKKWHILSISLIPFGLWMCSFVINYLLFTHKHAESVWIAYWFRSYHNFMPFPPKSIADISWFGVNLYRMMDYPLGLLWNFMSVTSSQSINMLLKMPFLPIALLALGIFALFKVNRSNFFLLITPVCLMFLASGLELYPLTERFWVFISPVFIILIAKGYEFLSLKLKSGLLQATVFLLLIIGPLAQSVGFVTNPDTFYVHKKSFQREALMYVNDHYKANDAVYVYWNNLPDYKIYKEMYNLKYTAVEGTDQRNNSKNFEDYYHNLAPDFKKLAGSNRVWLIYNTQFVTDIGDKIDEPKWYYQNGVNPTDHLIKEFSANYKPLNKFVTKDVTVYLLQRK